MNAMTSEERLAALNEESRKLHLCEFWTEIKALERVDPPPLWRPHVWRYEEVYPRLLQAAEIVPLEQAERRAVVFRNPAFPERIATTPTHYAAYSLYNGGERATVHRHTANAARIGLAGVGGYTTVEGTKYSIGRGDLVLTPNWTWHDHGNEGGELNVWFDILDVPLFVHVNALFFDFDYFERCATGRERQSIQTPREHVSAQTYAGAANGVRSLHLSPSAEIGAKRSFFYPWTATRAALSALRPTDIDPYIGASVRLINTETGASAMDTMDITVVRVPGVQPTRPLRHSANSVFLIMEGSGFTEIEGERYEWKENDVLYVPNWRWHRHVSSNREQDAVLYAITDMPILRQVGAVRRQGRLENGDVVDLGG